MRIAELELRLRVVAQENSELKHSLGELSKYTQAREDEWESQFERQLAIIERAVHLAEHETWPGKKGGGGARARGGGGGVGADELAAQVRRPAAPARSEPPPAAPELHAAEDDAAEMRGGGGVRRKPKRRSKAKRKVASITSMYGGAAATDFDAVGPAMPPSGAKARGPSAWRC